MWAVRRRLGDSGEVVAKFLECCCCFFPFKNPLSLHSLADVTILRLIKTRVLPHSLQLNELEWRIPLLPGGNDVRASE
jgi:hypothetical protein